MSWATQWVQDMDDWRLIVLDIAGDNPAETRRIENECSYSDVSEAWTNSRRKIEGTGYKIKQHGKR